MASGIVIHVANGKDSFTEVLSQERIRVGTGEDCQLRLRSSSLPSAFVLELARANGHYRVTEFDPALELRHNGSPLAPGAEIEDGDEVRVGESPLALQFYPVRELPAVVPHRRSNVAPFIEHAAVEAQATARRDDAKVFLREFTRELIREVSLTTKVITLLLAIALGGGILYIGDSLYRELKRSRDTIEKQNEHLARLQDELNKTGQEFQQLDKSNKDIIESFSLAPRLRTEFGNGVCLITGSYELVEAGTGRKLRYPETQTTEDGTTLQNGEEQPILTPEGTGTPYVADFVGTGFHVGGGYVVTNKHLVVEPWTASGRAQTLSATVRGVFRVTRVVAFFPNHRQPFVLRVRQAAQREDLAVATVEGREMPADIPALPLDAGSGASQVGKAVVMMGYPSGEERLLATLPEAESRSIQQRFGSSLEALLAYLSERNYIKPLMTQGHITDIEARSVVYDARNAVGGSGSPLFGQSGRVIGVNYATFVQMPDTNYAVAVRSAISLLERAGWKSPEPPADPNTNANGPATKDARAATAPANAQAR